MSEHAPYPRGTVVAEYTPSDSAKIADTLADRLGTRGESVELSPEERSVEAAGAVVAHLGAELAGEHPELPPDEVGKLLDGEVADIVKAAGKDKVATLVGVIEEAVHPGVGGETAEALNKTDPDILEEALTTAVEGGISPTDIEQVTKAIDAAGLSVGGAVIHGSDEETIVSADDELFGPAEYLISPEAVLADTTSRLEVPMEKRKGQELTDLDSGDMLRPAIEVYFDESMADEVRKKLQERRVGIAKVNGILDAFDRQGVSIDDKITADMLQGESDDIVTILAVDINDEDLYVPRGLRARRRSEKICEILRNSGVNGANIDTEGQTVGGDVADLYTSLEDISLGESLHARLSALGDEFVYKDPMTRENIAHRIEAFVDGVIPADSQLFHVMGMPSLEGILQDGQLSTRIEAGAQAAGHEQGSWSNLVHFGEVGKLNSRYGRYAIGIPIETIMATTPFVLQEPEIWSPRSEDPDSNGATYSQHYGRVRIPTQGADTAAAVTRRRVLLENRYKFGLLLQPSGGDTNNLAFAASLEPSTAARYAYPIDGATIISSVDHDRYRNNNETFAQILVSHYDRNDIDFRTVTVDNGSVMMPQLHPKLSETGLSSPSGRGGGHNKAHSDLKLETPGGLLGDELVGFGPIVTRAGAPYERYLHQIEPLGVPTTKRETFVEQKEREANEQREAKLRKDREESAAAMNMSVDEWVQYDSDQADAARAGMSYEDFIKLSDEQKRAAIPVPDY